MTLANKKITTVLFALQAVGVVFVGIFLAAYLGGLPTTAVLHSEPAFKIPLIIFGAVLLIIILVTIILAAATKASSRS
jgi:hypothetical protein